MVFHGVKIIFSGFYFYLVNFFLAISLSGKPVRRVVVLQRCVGMCDRQEKQTMRTLFKVAETRLEANQSHESILSPNYLPVSEGEIVRCFYPQSNTKEYTCVYNNVCGVREKKRLLSLGELIALGQNHPSLSDSPKPTPERKPTPL